MDPVRSVPSARIIQSGEIVRADDIFADRHAAFEYRNKALRDGIKFKCLECGQSLRIRPSSRKNLHFFHLPGADNCFYTDKRYSDEDREDIDRINRAKESDRHKWLKAEIARKLKVVSGVSEESVKVEKNVSSGERFRRPDVRCEYDGKRLVFEIQLGYLSPEYVLGRIDFYKSQQTYLIWILDAFEKESQKSHELMIKYQTPYQNFFKLDEGAEDFRLICDFKEVFTKDDLSVRQKWKQASVLLDQLNFNAEAFDVFFYDFPGHLERQEFRAEEKRREAIEERKREKLEDELDTAIEFVREDLRYCYLDGQRPSLITQRAIEGFTTEEKKHLNKRLGFKSLDIEGIPILYFLLRNNKVDFFRFLIESSDIKIDVNRRIETDNSLIKEMFQVLRQFEYANAVKCFYKNGYRALPEDKTLLKSYLLDSRNQRDYSESASVMYTMLLLDDHNLASLLNRNMNYPNVIRSILALKDGDPGYYNFANFIALSHNFFNTEPYLEFGDIYLKAIDVYGLKSHIQKTDKSGKFNKKINKYKRSNIRQSAVLKPILTKLFPEINT